MTQTHGEDFYLNTSDNVFKSFLVRCECGAKFTGTTLKAARAEHKAHGKDESR